MIRGMTGHMKSRAKPINASQKTQIAIAGIFIECTGMIRHHTAPAETAAIQKKVNTLVQIPEINKTIYQTSCMPSDGAPWLRTPLNILHAPTTLDQSH